MRRRSAASASREQVKAFSLTSNCCRAASQSCGDTIGGLFIASCPFPRSFSFGLLVVMSFLPCFVKQTDTTRFEKSFEFADVDHDDSACRSDASNHHCCACDARWTHTCLQPSSSLDEIYLANRSLL